MIHQLRVYRIEKSLRAKFDKRFSEHAYRIMKTYNFKAVAMWYSELGDQLEFVYILEWPDEATMNKQWNAFMNDTEWENIKQRSREQYGQMVLAKVKDQVLHDTLWFSE